MMALNVSALAPTSVHSIVDAFFEVKKSEMKQQVALELDQMRLQMDRAVENMFGGLVAQVKQLLIPVQQQQPEEDGTSTSVVVPNGGHKSMRESTTHPESDAVKPVPRPADKGPNEDLNVKRAKDSIVSSSEPKNRASARSLSSTEQKQIIKNSSTTPIKNEPQHQLPKAIHYAIKSVPRPSVSVLEGINSCSVANTGDMVKNRENSQSGDPEHQSATNRPLKRQRTESSSTNHSQAARPETVESPASKLACKTCGKSFCDNSGLKRHSRIHQSAKPYQCKWPDCSYASANSGDILRHIRGLHFKQSRNKNGSAQEGVDPRDPKEFIQVDKELLN